MEKERLPILLSTHWKKIGVRHHHGIVVPLFSLHSQNSCGIGEYTDLIPLCTWCREIGFDTLQLLPLNDTGLDTSPYSALSANALHPLYLGLAQLPYVSQNPQLLQQLETLKLLNRSHKVLYKEVQSGKEHFLRAYYAQYRDKIMSAPDYYAFRTNHAWTIEYALFKTLKIINNWQNWESWPALYRDPSPGFYQHLPPDIQSEMEYHIALQYLCFNQLKQVKQHATEGGIFLKGDIPILINRESDSVWYQRHLFHLDLIAGAPPDMYANEGQKWGFPIYNWEALATQHYRWWMERLAIAATFYHIYRLDHIVGFFRIWAIPKLNPARKGFFFPLEKERWISQGEGILKNMLSACSMLPIGEDLGTVPIEVRECLHRLGICGTKVMRWEKHWETDQSFICPQAYLPVNMTTVSTHDSETLQQWWESNPEEARAFAEMARWDFSLTFTKELRLAFLHASHQSGTLFHINLLQEYLALIPGMVSNDPSQERINVPGTFSESNWCYRFMPSIEEIINNHELKQLMRSFSSGLSK